MSYLYSRPITELKSALTHTVINNAIRWWKATLIDRDKLGDKVISLIEHLDSCSKQAFIETYEFYSKKANEIDRRIKHEADSNQVSTSHS